MKKPTIALVTMVKNEEKTILRLLDSVAGFVDKLIFLDTGSTDNTLAILEAAGADIKKSTFIDFGQSRTELMEYAWGKADWLLLMDADHTLVFTPDVTGSELKNVCKARLDLDVPCYSLLFEGSCAYWTTRIVRGNMKWAFKGTTHEYLEHSEMAIKLVGVTIEHHNDGGCRADKLPRDRALLEAEFRKDPTNSRALFYLANTERDMNLRNSARDLYLRRAKMGGWEEERWYAQLEAAKVSLDPLEFWECWAMRPERAEPMQWLARIYMGRNQMGLSLGVEGARAKIPLPDDILFVDKASYGPERIPQPLVPWQMIPGWFDYADVYRRIVKGMPDDDGMFAEIGVWHGRSLAAFDYFAKQAKKNIHLVAVDTFDGTPTALTQAGDKYDKYDGGYYSEFLRNMKRCGVTNLGVDVGPSVSAASEYKNGIFDAVFIDGDHSYEAVKADLRAWYPKIKSTGLIAGHDYDRPDVKRAVWEFFCGSQVQVFGRTWLVEL